MNLDAMKRSTMKQRSFYMDDETYALIEAKAAAMGESNGAALRALVRGAAAAAVAQVDQRIATIAVETGLAPPTSLPAERQIVLPPDDVETFTIKGEPTRAEVNIDED